MILPLPLDVGFSFIASPVWKLLAPPPSPAATEGSALEAAQPEAAPAPVLTFAGYRWIATPTWHPFVNPGWDRFVENDAGEIGEAQQRQEQDRRTLERLAAAARPAEPGARPADAAGAAGDGTRSAP